MACLVLAPDSVWVGSVDHPDMIRHLEAVENTRPITIKFQRAKPTFGAKIMFDLQMFLMIVGSVLNIAYNIGHLAQYRLDGRLFCFVDIPEVWSSNFRSFATTVLFVATLPFNVLLVLNGMYRRYLRYLFYWVFLQNRALTLWLLIFAVLYPLLYARLTSPVTTAITSFLIPCGLSALDAISFELILNPHRRGVLAFTRKIYALCVITVCTRRYIDVTVLLTLCDRELLSLGRIICELILHIVSSLAVVSLARTILPSQLFHRDKPSISFRGDCHFVAVESHPTDQALPTKNSESSDPTARSNSSKDKRDGTGQAQSGPAPHDLTLVRYNASGFFSWLSQCMGVTQRKPPAEADTAAGSSPVPAAPPLLPIHLLAASSRIVDEQGNFNWAPAIPEECDPWSASPAVENLSASPSPLPRVVPLPSLPPLSAPDAATDLSPSLQASEDSPKDDGNWMGETVWGMFPNRLVIGPSVLVYTHWSGRIEDPSSVDFGAQSSVEIESERAHFASRCARIRPLSASAHSLSSWGFIVAHLFSAALAVVLGVLVGLDIQFSPEAHCFRERHLHRDVILIAWSLFTLALGCAIALFFSLHRMHRALAKFAGWWLSRQKVLVFVAMPFLLAVTAASVRALEIVSVVTLVLGYPVGMIATDALILLLASTPSRLNRYMLFSMRLVCSCLMFLNIAYFAAFQTETFYECSDGTAKSAGKLGTILARRASAAAYSLMFVVLNGCFLKKVINPASPCVTYDNDRNYQVRF